MELKSKVELRGSKKKGWIISVSDNYNFFDELALTHEELLALVSLIKKKTK